ncbi:cytidine deaminase [Ktedonobacter sp. SOSP1-52]|uniref:cytidine deaminase n=1 Tax=Ktedonobacter sp. SOSP1-52 TaxID=2778366 RepID=UPI0019154A90|nr:cytidine deaminase [Ktedonobacter sp. SOSP1-52]GHO71795.1 cytidine deaminase [Ktedonobacter sp. SOSP1-52]
MKLDQRLVDAAIELMNKRFPKDEEAGAAAMYTEDGEILTSVSPDIPNGAAALCHETGALCEAYKLDKKVTASVCVNRAANAETIRILTPCGICQERLFMWGPDVEVAVPDPKDTSKWIAKKLAEVQPYYWFKVFTTEQ